MSDELVVLYLGVSGDKHHTRYKPFLPPVLLTYQSELG